MLFYLLRWCAEQRLLLVVLIVALQQQQASADGVGTNMR